MSLLRQVCLHRSVSLLPVRFGAFLFNFSRALFVGMKTLRRGDRDGALTCPAKSPYKEFKHRCPHARRVWCEGVGARKSDDDKVSIVTHGAQGSFGERQPSQNHRYRGYPNSDRLTTFFFQDGGRSHGS